MAVTAAHLVAVCGRAGPLLFWRRADVLGAVAGLYALVAAGALAFSRAGLTVLGIREPIVELTAVHYVYAGAGALVLAGHTLDTCAFGRTARAAVVLTSAAPPVVATGFVTRSALLQVGGAVLMTLGVWLTAGLQLRTARRAGPRVATVLLTVSGLAVWAPMVLAVAWAAGQHWAVPVLSIPDMARTHGLANALAFVMCGLAGRHIEAAARLRADRRVAA